VATPEKLPSIEPSPMLDPISPTIKEIFRGKPHDAVEPTIPATIITFGASPNYARALWCETIQECEVWRCESAEGSNECDSAAEQGRKYCLTHLAFKPQ
jgi:hypothetical protein